MMKGTMDSMDHIHDWETIVDDDAITKACACGSLARIRVTKMTIEPVELVGLIGAVGGGQFLP